MGADGKYRPTAYANGSLSAEARGKHSGTDRDLHESRVDSAHSDDRQVVFLDDFDDEVILRAAAEVR